MLADSKRSDLVPANEDLPGGGHLPSSVQHHELSLVFRDTLQKIIRP